MKKLLFLFLLPSLIYGENIYLNCKATSSQYSSRDDERLIKVNTDKKIIEVWDYLKVDNIFNQFEKRYSFTYSKYVDLEVTDRFYKGTIDYFYGLDNKQYTRNPKNKFHIDRYKSSSRHMHESKTIGQCKKMNALVFRYQVKKLEKRAKDSQPKAKF